MSFDLTVYTTKDVDSRALSEALDQLGAPCAVDESPSRFAGFVPVRLTIPGMEALDVGFEAYYSREVWADEAPVELAGADDVVRYRLSGHAGDDQAAQWTVALALAVAGDGVVVDQQTGRTYFGARCPRIIRMIGRWKARLGRRHDRLPEAEKAWRVRAEGESLAAYRERLWLKTATEPELIDYVRSRLPKALAHHDELETARLLALVPREVVSLEAVLDPCFRAGRLDIARRIVRRFGRPAIRAHFAEAVTWVGVAAVPYARFIASLVDVRVGGLLHAARDSVQEADMRAWLATL